MGDEHWETIPKDSKLEKPDEVNVDLNAGPPDFPPEFVERYGDLMRDFTRALAEIAHSGDAEGLQYLYNYMRWIVGVTVKEIAVMKSGKPQWH